MMTENHSAAQMWIRQEVGNGAKYINAETMLPLMTQSNDPNDIWILDDQERLVVTSDPENSRAMDRGWNQQDGAIIGLYNKHGGPNQKFEIVPSKN